MHGPIVLYLIVRNGQEYLICVHPRAQVVCMCDSPLALQVAVNEACAAARAATGAGPYYVAAEARGLFGRMFADFGDAFTVSDVTGEPPKTAIIAHISNVSLLVH